LKIFLLSGRRRRDVENRVGVAGITYLGLHGWEGRKAGEPRPIMRSLLRSAKRQLQDRLAGLQGVWIEEKGPILTIHVRGASPRTAGKAGSFVRQVMASFEPHLRILPGNHIWEVIPPELPGKGAAARMLLREMPAETLPFYLGDDTTDESAFTALPEGITVCVGDRQPTKARFRLRGPREVYRFLQRLERELPKALASCLDSKRQEQFHMANGKEQISNCHPARLPFAI
jgi:trehalose-phosphatase